MPVSVFLHRFCQTLIQRRSIYHYFLFLATFQGSKLNQYEPVSIIVKHYCPLFVSPSFPSFHCSFARFTGNNHHSPITSSTIIYQYIPHYCWFVSFVTIQWPSNTHGEGWSSTPNTQHVPQVIALLAELKKFRLRAVGVTSWWADRNNLGHLGIWWCGFILVEHA